MSVASALKLVVAEGLWSLRYRRPRNPDEREIFRELLTNGVCVRENFLSPEKVDQLVKEAEGIYRNQSQYIFHEGGDERIYGIDRLSESFHLPTEMKLPNAIEERFGIGWNKSWFQLFGRISAVPGNLGSGAGWHRDSPFLHQFKAIIYLTDVLTEETGPFEYIPGSHLKASIQRVSRALGTKPSLYRFTPEEIARAQAAGAVPDSKAFLARRGTLIMADTRGLHRGRPLLSGARMALTRYYYAFRKPWYWRKFPLLQVPTLSARGA